MTVASSGVAGFDNAAPVESSVDDDRSPGSCPDAGEAAGIGVEQVQARVELVHRGVGTGCAQRVVAARDEPRRLADPDALGIPLEGDGLEHPFRVGMVEQVQFDA